MNTLGLIPLSCLRLAIIGGLALCLDAGAITSVRAADESAAASASTKIYEPAAVRAAPGLQCMLYAPGTDSSKGIPVSTDDDGYVRFYAVKPTGQDPVQRLTLDCKDANGKASSYTVNLASSETFAPHPLDFAKEKGIDRPALKGDPQSFGQAELIERGYGLRPDREKNPAAYARWLAAASKPGRMLEAKHPDLHSHSVTSQESPWWVGSVLTGAPDYLFTEAVWNVPQAIPGGDQTTTTVVAVWNGLGGFGTGSGLIQGGVNLYTTPTAATYGTWREYCCGDPNSNGYGGNFTPSPGDQIYSEEWYCDAKGNVNIDGGYGCTYLYDMNSGAIFNCTLPGGSPCWSVKALPLCSVSPGSKGCMTPGKAAEFIIENQSPQVSSSSTAFTDFSGTLTISGSAESSKTNTESQTVSTDPDVSVLTDFTKTTSHIVVSLAAPDQTIFWMEPTQPAFPLYCQGPLSTSASLEPQTPFKWATEGAGAANPGKGECAWADRGPRSIEIKPGGGNVIYGFLNQLANLPDGKFFEIGVYRDPKSNNDMVVTQLVGFVTPPFSPKPVLP
jgi:hypothetical protein